MKRFATALVCFLLSITVSSGFTQTNQGQVLLPDGFHAKPIPCPFVAKPTFINLGKPHSAPLGANKEALSYFSPDMFDVNGQLVMGQYSTFALPDTFDRALGQTSDGTYLTNHFMERFTSTLDQIYLDSVLVGFAVDTVALRVTSFVFGDTVNAQGNPVPWFAKGALASSSIAKALLHGKDTIAFYTINYKHKKLVTDPDFPQNFYVSLSTLTSTSGNPFFANPPTSKSRIAVLGDRIIDSRNYDPQLDRSWSSATRLDGQWVVAGPLEHRYFNVNAPEDTSWLYPNFYMVAYVSNGTSAVNDVKLEGNALAQNFPNPFNPSTEIKYSLATGGKTTLKVINALGNEVASLVDGYVASGEHTAKFDGSTLPSGTYFYSLKCGEFSSTKRMVLAK